MTKHREQLSSSSYVDDEGDVLPYADVADTFDSQPTQNSSIVQGVENLKNHALNEVALEQFEAEAKQQREDAVIKAGRENAGVHVALEQYYQDQLDLLDFVSGSLMRRGFKKGGSKKPEALDRYGSDLPNVEAGADRNHKRQVHRDLPKIYHADELIAAGFEPQEVMFDAKTQMRSEAQHRLGGPSNKNKRAALRKELRAKRDSHHQ